MKNSTLFCSFLSLFLLLCTTTVSAQATGTRYYQASTTLEAAHYKVLFSALRSVDADGILSVEGTMMKVRSTASDNALLAAFNGTGIGDVRPVATRSATAQTEMPPFPVLMDTGDPEADQAAYLAAKAAWIAANSDAEVPAVAPSIQVVHE